MSTIHDVIIVGSGPAGYTAAIYAARANLKPIVFAGALTAGGALMNTSDVENFPGFPEGLMGPDLMERMQAQAERFGADIKFEDAIALELTDKVKTVTSEDGTEYRSKTVILATGSAYRELGLENEKRLSGKGVSWCATCDGFFFKDQDIAVVGGGDSALEEATFLTKFAKSVTLIHRREEFRGSKIMQERALNNDKIRVEWNTVVADVLGDDKMTGLKLADTNTGEERTLDATGLFIAIGHDPRVELFKDVVTLDEEGYIACDGRSGKTNIPGVFACGDVVDHSYRQAITAAGSGCAAALDAERYLSDED